MATSFSAEHIFNWKTIFLFKLNVLETTISFQFLCGRMVSKPQKKANTRKPTRFNREQLEPEYLGENNENTTLVEESTSASN